MLPFDLLRLACATFILAYSLSFLDMPFGIARRLRERFPNTKLFTCPYCNGVWIALALYAIDHTIPGYFVNDVLAIAGAMSLLYRWTGANHV